ncbi:MAG: nucleotide sugar dehydrogenase [Synergistaceae bacterium]|jgi:UDPglucose 6-dehydrogenase|nr:nucleotide sugar dehydrogenase [Synergistaceae bacterium]
MKISVIGLGKLGLCTAACIASKGHSVVGVDNSEPVVNALKKRLCPIRENGLEDLLEKSFKCMTFTMDVHEAILGTDVTLIIVPTPSGPSGAFVNDRVTAVLETAAPALAQKKDFHVVDVVSTVMPGSSQREFIPLLEEAARKKCGVDFGFIYNPEFIALGSVIRDFLNPDLVLIGASDEKSGETVRNLYESFVDSAPEFAVMTLINAEITKLALNCYVTMKITYANELARLCEAVEGADVDVVTGALGADTRVGRRCLKGGLGFAGPCFPRDNAAFQKFAADAGVELFLSPQVVRSNDSIVDYLFSVAARRVEKGATIALLGFAYKPGTHITECSQSLALMNRFLEAGYRIAAHDPMAEVEIPSRHGDAATVYGTPEEAVAAASAVLLLTPWPEYSAMDWEKLCKERPIYFFDCWRIAKNIPLGNAKARYWALG